MPSASSVGAMSGAVSISLRSDVSPAAEVEHCVVGLLRHEEGQELAQPAGGLGAVAAGRLLDSLEPGGERAVGGIERGQNRLAALLGHASNEPADLDRLAAIAAADHEPDFWLAAEVQ